MVRSMLTAGSLVALVTTVLMAQSPVRQPGVAGGDSTRAAAESPGVLVQLLSEVRQLRLTMQRQSADGARIQLLVSRLTIQETRVSRIAQDLDRTREELARMPEEERQTADQAKALEAALATASDQERREMEGMLQVVRRQQEHHKAREQRLRAREAELDSSMGVEQARWIEVNNRLDELDQSLERP